MRRIVHLAIAASLGFWLNEALHVFYDRAMTARPIERLHP